MGDYISRNAITKVLNTMHRYVADELTLCDTEKKFPRNEVFIVDDVYEEIVEQLPPADVRENRWIPVTEKLPKDHEEVLIYLSTNRITIGVYNSHVLPIRPYKPIGWGVNAKTAVHNFCSDDVIAWQPLPEPYKAENHETCKGCIEPCIMYEPDMRGCKKKVTEKGKADGK